MRVIPPIRLMRCDRARAVTRSSSGSAHDQNGRGNHAIGANGDAASRGLSRCEIGLRQARRKTENTAGHGGERA